MEDGPWTIGRILQWSTEHLKQRGADSPRLDAELLLAHARQAPRIQLYTQLDELPAEEQLVVFRDLLKRRGRGEPVAYLIGHREFFSLDFEVSPAVLIPRPDTEHLVVAALDAAKRKTAPPAATAADTPPAASATEPAQASPLAAPSPPPITLRIADIGTGSGCVAIALAKHLPQAEVWAIDRSPDALSVARRNVERHGLCGRVHCWLGDLLEPIGGATDGTEGSGVPIPERLDIIVSNPPYVSADEYATLPRQVKDFEPRAALLAGPTGMEIIERLVAQAERRLVGGGRLLIELSPMLAGRLLGWWKQRPGWELQPIIKDLAQLERVAVGKWSDKT